MASNWIFQNVFNYLTGKLRSGLPPFQLPPFQTIVGNQTFSFGEMCSELGSSIILVPVIAVLGNVAIAKAFGKCLQSFSTTSPSRHYKFTSPTHKATQ